MTNQRLKNKVALITGASRGIGRAVAISLAGEGASVILAARTEKDLTQTAEAVRQAGGEPLVVPTDLTSEDSIKNLVRATADAKGRLDILVNNAGITLAGPLEQTQTADFDRVMAVNVRGPFILCREAIPLLKQSKPAYIVNISSVVGVKGYPNQSIYTASKHALRGMSMSLAEELKSHGIRVHVICPGGVDTDMVGNVRPDIKKEDLIAPQEIAELVLYLVTHKGNAVLDELHIRRATSSPWF
jgi:3-oxoacyl-[acyl-carrier protein] reductase